MNGANFTNEHGYGRINAHAALKYTLENYGGTLSGDVTITENLKIQPGNTLTIAPGTTIRFHGSTTTLTVKQGAKLVLVR